MNTNRSVKQLPFSQISEGTYHCDSSLVQPGVYTLLILFDAKAYPLLRHYRFVHHSDSSLDYTFSNMIFTQEPPGLRVGPWPGWRDIPPMPETKLLIGAKEYSGRFDFWGDELSQQHVRCIYECVIEKGNALVLSVEDPRLIPQYAHLYGSNFHRAEAIPVSLRAELMNQHPRLLFTSDECESLRKKAQSSHKHFWNRIVSLLNNWNVPAFKNPESKVVDNVERLFPEDRVIISAFIASIEPTQEHQTRAVHSLIDYAERTAQPDFEPLTIDTQSGEALFILCVGYDWCYAFLHREQKEKLQHRLFAVADICWNHLGYERRDYAQAHFLGCGMGLLAFSFLFWNEHQRAKEWANYLRGTLERVMNMLPEDGFYAHGINLWIYEQGFLLRWLELFRLCANEDLWTKTSYLKNTSCFRAAATTQDGLYGITFGDPQYRVAGDSWCHYLIASRTKSSEAQRCGDFLLDIPIDHVDYRSVPARRHVYEFLFYNESVPSKHANDTIRHFRDGGQIFIRNINPTKSSLFTFRSGFPLGRTRYLAGEHGGYGHSDPANGSFLLYVNGDFVFSGPGPTYRRDTSLHNTMTIDGQGQIGDSAVWIPDFLPAEHIPDHPEIQSDGNIVSISADLTTSYLPHVGVKSMKRNILVDLDNYIVGVDVAELRETRNIQWNMHSSGTFRNKQDKKYLRFDIQTMDDIFSLFILNPETGEWQTELTEMVPAYPHDGTRDHFLRVTKKSGRALFIWCLVLNQEIRPRIDLQDELNFSIDFKKDNYIRYNSNHFEFNIRGTKFI